MRVKPANPDHAIGLIDPQTRRTPFIDPDTKQVIEADVPDTTFWTRRLLAGEIVLVTETARAAQPTGSEPIQPLTTRER